MSFSYTGNTGILVAVLPLGIQDKSAEQVAITNTELYLGKAQQDMLDAGVFKELCEKEEYHFDKDSNSAHWEGQIKREGRIRFIITAIPVRARLSLKLLACGTMSQYRWLRRETEMRKKGHEERKFRVYPGGTDCGGRNPVHTAVYRGACYDEALTLPK